MANFTDNFNRASLGAGYQTSGSWSIFSNQLGVTNNNQSQIGSESVVSTNNQYSEITIATPNATGVLYLYARLNATVTHFFAIRVTSTTLSIQQTAGGAETSVAGLAFTRQSGDRIRLEVSGTTLRAYLTRSGQTQLVASGTATVNPIGNGFGLRLENAVGYRVDDAAWGDLAASTPPSVSITSPTDGATLSGTHNLVATVTAGTGTLTSVAASVDGAPPVAMTNTSGSTYQITGIDTTLLANGPVSVSVTAQNSAGVYASDTITVTVDNSGGGGGGTENVITVKATGNFGEQLAGTSVSIPVPAIVSGDYLVLYVLTSGSGAITPPAGWTQSGSPYAGSQLYIHTWWRYATGTASAGSISVTTPSGMSYGRVVVYENVSNVAPVFANGGLTTTYFATNAINATGYYTIFGVTGSVATFSSHSTNGSITVSSQTNQAWQGIPTASPSGTALIGLAVVTAAGGGTARWNHSGSASANLSRTLLLTPTVGGGADTTAPNVSITAPSASATVAGTVSFTALASDAVGVTGVDFYRGGSTLIGAATNTSGTTWTLLFDTTSLTDGPYSITARARDAATNIATSSAVAITVLNTVPASPVSFWDETSETELSVSTLKYWDGTSELEFDGSQILSYWDGTIETPLLPIGATVPNPDPEEPPVGGAQDYSGAYTAPTVGLDSTITSDGDSSLPAGAWAYPASSTAFRYLGVDTMVDTTDGDNTYRPNPSTVVSGSAYRPYSVKFNITGTTFWVRVKPLRANSTLRVRVNNNWDVVQETITYTADPAYPGTVDSTAGTSLSGATTGEICYVKVVFSEAGPHTIQLDMNYRFGGIYVPNSATLATQTVGSLPLVPTRRVYGLSASLFGGISQSSESPYGNTTSPIFRAAYNAGFTHVFDDSIGGSGYGASPSYLSRLQNATIQNRISGRSGDVIVIDGGAFNDLNGDLTIVPGTSSSGWVYNRVNPVLSLLRSLAPDLNIVIIGTPLAPAIIDVYKDAGASESVAENYAINGSGSTYGILDYNDVIRQIAANYGAFYFEPLPTDRRVRDTNGSVLGTLPSGAGRMPDYPTILASAAGTTYIHSDGVHPKKAGAFVIAEMYGDAINIMKTSANWKNP